MPKVKNRLYLRFRTPEGKQSPYCPAVYDSKSRLRPGWCLVRGTPEHHPEATYHQRIKRGGKWVWDSLGTDPHTAWCKSAALTVGEIAAPVIQPTSQKTNVQDGYRLDDEIKVYLSNAAKLAPKTYKAYKLSLDLFQECCNRTYMHQIGKQDLQAFDTFLLERKNDDRTRHNRVGHIVTFLRNKEGRRLGPEIKDVSIKVKYVESPPEAYTRKELEDLFGVSSEEDKYLWRFFLGSGFRESEVCAISSTIPDDLLSRLHRLARVMEPIGEKEMGIWLRHTLRAEAPGHYYGDSHDRLNYFRSPDAGSDFEAEVKRICEEYKPRIKARLAKVLGTSGEIGRSNPRLSGTH